MKKACQIHDGRVRDDMMIERRSGKMGLGRYKSIPMNHSR